MSEEQTNKTTAPQTEQEEPTVLADEEKKTGNETKTADLKESDTTNETKGWARFFNSISLPIFGLVVLWSFNVKSVHQLKEKVETEAKSLIDVVWIVLGIVWVPLATMTVAATASLIGYLLVGDGFTLMLLWGTVTAVLTYLILLAVMVIRLWGSFGAAKEDVGAILKGTGQLAGQIIFWNMVLLATLLEFKPALSDHKLEMFVGMLAAEIGLIALHKFFRTKIRIAVACWALLLGANFFIALLTGVDLMHHGINRAVTWFHDSSLPIHQQIVDINGDELTDGIDVRLVFQSATDSTLIRYEVIDGMNIPKGDYNGDFDVDSADGNQYQQWLKSQGPPPATIKQRSAFLQQVRLPETIVSSSVQQQNPLASDSSTIPVSGLSNDTLRYAINEDFKVDSYPQAFFTLRAEYVEITPYDTKVGVVWSNPRSADKECASVHSGSYLFHQKQRLSLVAVEDTPVFHNSVPLRQGETVRATLIFPPLDPDTRAFEVVVRDMWDHAFEGEIYLPRKTFAHEGI